MQVNIRRSGEMLFFGNGTIDIAINTQYMSENELGLIIAAAIKQLSTQD